MRKFLTLLNFRDFIFRYNIFLYNVLKKKYVKI